MKPTYEELEKLIVIKDEALKEAIELIDIDTCTEFPHELEMIHKALSTSPESIAAWEAEKLLPLQRQVAMLRELLCVLRAWSYTPGNVEDSYRYHRLFPTNYRPSTTRPLWSNIINAISNTQATAEAYDREHAAKVRSVALEDVGAMIAVGATINELSDYVLKELRAANKKEWS